LFFSYQFSSKLAEAFLLPRKGGGKREDSRDKTKGGEDMVNHNKLISPINKRNHEQMSNTFDLTTPEQQSNDKERHLPTVYPKNKRKASLTVRECPHRTERTF
jgi:hypothetical protein